MVAVLPALGDPPPAAAMDEAGRALRSGQVVAVPTDTVYGLAVDPFGTGAADRLFAAKHRPREVHLPVLVADTDQALGLAGAVPEVAERLMARFWPGALTVVLPRRPGLAADLGADEATVGLRCPAHPVPRALCRMVGPLATTSANLHGRPPLTTASEVAEAFADAVAVVLDGGTCAGSPSTVVECTGAEPGLLREGSVSWEDIRRAAGQAGR